MGYDESLARAAHGHGGRPARVAAGGVVHAAPPPKTPPQHGQLCDCAASNASQPAAVNKPGPSPREVRGALRQAVVANLEAQRNLAHWVRARAAQLGAPARPEAMGDQLERQITAAATATHKLAESYRLLVGEFSSWVERLVLEEDD